MKRIQIIILLLGIASLHALSQTYKIDTSEISFENKLRPCLSVFYDASAKTTKSAWVKFFKKNYKINVKGLGLLSNKDIIEAKDITIGSISDKRMNMYARVIDHANGSEMKFFMSFGYDFFIGPADYSKEFGGMKIILNDFSVKFLNNYYASEASSLTRKIKKLEKDQKSKRNDISKNLKKARKESSAVATGLEVKNNSIQREIEEIDTEIKNIKTELEEIKVKQGGIIRN